MIVTAVVVAALLATQDGACAAPFTVGRPRAGELAGDPALSLGGVPGLFAVPAAVEAPPSSFAIGYDNSLAPSALRGPWRQRDAFLAFEFLPRLTLSARGAVIDDSLGGFYSRLRDLSANAHLLVMRESGWRPAFAVGAIDLSGADALYTARYAVATKTLFGRVRASAGYSHGKLIHGAFGGVALGICDWLSLIAEHDGKDANLGARVTLFPRTLGRFGVVPTVGIFQRGHGPTDVTIGARFPLPGARLTVAEERDDRANTASAPLTIPDGVRSTDALTRAIADEGLENVRVQLADAGKGTVLRLTYENRRFWWDEWEALGAVLSAVARHAPAAAARVEISVRRLDLPVMHIAADVAAVRAFVTGAMSPDAFGASLDFSSDRTSGAAVDGAAVNSSAWRLDLTAKARVETQLMTELAVVQERVSALPEATLQLGHGITIAARRALQLYESPKFWTKIADPNADRLLANIARPLPALFGESGFTQLSVGRFGHDEVGIADEVDLTIAGGRGSLGGTFAVFGEHFQRMDRSVALGTFRWRDAPTGLSAAITAGRYLHGDVGGGLEVQRLFGPVEIAFNVISTDAQSVGRLRVSLPLGSPHDARPSPVRFRWPGYHDQDIQSTIFSSYPVLRRDVGVPLETGGELARVIRQRDRLMAPMLLAHLGEVRAAALRRLTRPTD